MELVVAALVGAVLGWPITKALDGLTADNTLPWWLYLVGMVVGIAAVLLIMSFFLKEWRSTVWGGLGKMLGWMWSWHPVSARRHQAELIELERRVLDDLDKVVEGLTRKHIERARSVDRDIALLGKIQIDRGAEIREAVAAELKRSAAAAPKAAPELPPPDPRWTITQPDEGDREHFRITNHVLRSVAKEVRVDGEADEDGYTEIDILDAAHFEDLSGSRSGDFRARFSGQARQNGASFQVSWYDENGARIVESLFLRGWEERAPRPSPWNQGPNDETPF